MKVYLAGPMRGYKDFNFGAFERAATLLRSVGVEVLSPHENDAHEGEWAKQHPEYNPAKGETGEQDHAKALRFFMQKDLPMVLSCDAVALLPGWQDSKGACLEAHVAQACGIRVDPVEKILFQDENLTPFDPAKFNPNIPSKGYG